MLAPDTWDWELGMAERGWLTKRERMSMGHGPSRIKIASIENQRISHLLPYGALILVGAIICIVLTANVLERWLLRRAYGRLYKDLECEKEDKRRRSFVYHHIALGVMVPILCIGVYPASKFLFGSEELSDFALPKSRRVTIGDILFMLFHVYSAYYVFEISYRTKLASYITIAHHIGLLVIAQLALGLSGNLAHNREATIEFYMCLVWGAFDVIAEIPQHAIMIIWRIKRTQCQMLSWLGFGLCIWVVTLACAETAVTIYLLARSWHRWGTEWKVVTPVVFTLWICAQLHGARVFYGMARRERAKTFEEGTGV